MPNKDNYWVTREGIAWKVKREGAERASSLHPTQAEAWIEAKRLARLSKGEAILQGENGKIRGRNSYGNDPYPPKG
ncbi:DUF2188 domain-containing protein [Alphaproteobacteria bacterium LSUCC0684]